MNCNAKANENATNSIGIKGTCLFLSNPKAIICINSIKSKATAE